MQPFMVETIQYTSSKYNSQSPTFNYTLTSNTNNCGRHIQ